MLAGHIPSAIESERAALSERRIAALRRAVRELEAAALPHDGAWLDGRRSWPGALPADIEPLPYTTALARYQPGIVLCAWMPLGEDWTPAFRTCASVTDYILIGEGPGGCTGTPESFAAPPPWRRASLRDVARWGLTRNADRAFSTSVYHFHRPAQ